MHWLAGDTCLSVQLSDNQKTRFISLKEEAERWGKDKVVIKRWRDYGVRGWRSDSAEKEKLAVCWVKWVWWWSVCSHQHSVCAVHMLFWQSVSKRSRRNTWGVCVCVCVCVVVCVCVCVGRVKRWGEVHTCVRPQFSLHTSYAFIRRVCRVPVGPPSLHPSIHPSIHPSSIHPYTTSHRFFLCSVAMQVLQKRGWGSTQMDEDYLQWQMGLSRSSGFHTILLLLPKQEKRLHGSFS